MLAGRSKQQETAIIVVLKDMGAPQHGRGEFAIDQRSAGKGGALDGASARQRPVAVLQGAAGSTLEEPSPQLLAQAPAHRQASAIAELDLELARAVPAERADAVDANDGAAMDAHEGLGGQASLETTQ